MLEMTKTPQLHIYISVTQSADIESTTYSVKVAEGFKSASPWTDIGNRTLWRHRTQKFEHEIT